MRWKKIAKTLLIVGVSLVVLVGLAFATFVYNPFEGSFGEIRKAVPSTVEFYVGKRELRGDFEEFPEPSFWGSFVGTPWHGRLQGGRFFRTRAAEMDRGLRQLADLDAQLTRVPVLGVDILGDAIGSDLVLAGRLRASGHGFDFCAYSRVSWKIRAALSLLEYEFVRSKLQGARVTVEEEGLFRIEAPGAEPMFVTRVQDLAIAGNALPLVKTSRDLATGVSEQDVILSSADYNDQLKSPLADWSERTGQTPNSIETMVDVAMLRRWNPAFAAWPGRADDLSREERLLDSFVNQTAMRRLWTSVVFEDPAGLTALSHLVVNHGQLTGFQKRFHNEPGGNVDRWLRGVLALVPSTAGMAAVLRVPPGAFLTEMYHILERAAQDLLEDGLRAGGVKGGVRGLIDRVAPGLEPWVGIVFRNNEYPPIIDPKTGKRVEFKVYIPSPAPAWALIFRASRGGEAMVSKLIGSFKDQIRYRLEFNGPGMQMRAGPGNEILIQEWGNRHIEGTGQIALFFDGTGSRYFFVSNSGKLLREVVNTRYRLRGSRPLSSDPDLAEVLGELPETISGFAWLQGDECRQIVRKYQEFTRQAMASELMDQGWALRTRPGVAQQVFDQSFRGRFTNQAQLRGADAQRFDEMVQSKLEALWARERVRLGKDLDRRFADLGAWLEYLESGYVVLRTRPKDLRLEARLFPRW